MSCFSTINFQDKLSNAYLLALVDKFKYSSSYESNVSKYLIPSFGENILNKNVEISLNAKQNKSIFYLFKCSYRIGSTFFNKISTFL